MLSIHWYYSFYLPFPPFTPHTPSHISSQHPSNTKNIIIKSHQWAISSVVECLLSVEDAAGSIPALSNVYIFYWYYWMYVMCVCGWDDVWMWWDVCEGWECEDMREWDESGVGWWWEKCKKELKSLERISMRRIRLYIKFKTIWPIKFLSLLRSKLYIHCWHYCHLWWTTNPYTCKI